MWINSSILYPTFEIQEFIGKNDKILVAAKFEIGLDHARFVDGCPFIFFFRYLMYDHNIMLDPRRYDFVATFKYTPIKIAFWEMNYMARNVLANRSTLFLRLYFIYILFYLNLKDGGSQQFCPITSLPHHINTNEMYRSIFPRFRYKVRYKGSGLITLISLERVKLWNLIWEETKL